MTARPALIAESHRRQFHGEDYQAVAISIAEANGVDYDSDAYTALQSAPDENCKCKFCVATEWPQQ